MTIELTVLGCAGSHTGVGRACSGYLIEAGGQRLLLDAGNGSTANLQRFVPLSGLDAVVVSHRHVDHCIDLIGCYYNLRFDPHRPPPLPLYAAAEVHELLTSLLSSDSPMSFDDVFTHHPVAGGDRFDLGDVRLTIADSVHPVPAVSVRLEVGGTSIVYSGDTAGGPALVDLARGVDLFLCEATWIGDPDDYPPGIHLTAGQAAAIAREAGVGRLVLTHLAGGTDRATALAEARAVFEGPVELADDLTRYRVGDPDG